MTYGGGLWRTWFDRDLILAGKVIVKEDRRLVSKYWKSDRPLVNIPSLCIHLDTEREAFSPNKEKHLKPVMSTQIIDQLFGEGVPSITDDLYNLDKNHMKTLTSLISEDLKISRDSIVNFELSLADAMPAAITGIHQEFVSSPRLDNLASSFASLDALVAQKEKRGRGHSEIDMVMLFDHEEVGSKSA